MTRDRRGFTYALDPMRIMNEWNMNDAMREMAARNAAAHAQQERVDTLAGHVEGVRGDVMAQRQTQALLDINGQRLAHAYMLHLQQQLTAESGELDTLQKQCDETFVRLRDLRRYADTLEKDKARAGDEYDQEIARKSYQEADDTWLQRLHWRKST